jgi:uncharacterized protein
MRLRLQFLSILLAAVACATFASAEPVSSLKPTNYVNDFAGVLSSATQDRLNGLCREVEQKTQAQIVVVTIKSSDGRER